jgi:hypothetical protein
VSWSADWPPAVFQEFPSVGTEVIHQARRGDKASGG